MRLNSRWLAALILLAVLPLYSCGFYNRLQARDNVGKGVSAFAEEKYDESTQFFQKAIEMDPDFPDDLARMYLASAYMLQFVPGSIDPKSKQMALKAIETFSEVVERSEAKGTPNVNAMLAIASLHYQMQNVEKTKEWCERILRIDPNTEEERNNKAEAYYRIAVIDYDTVHEATGLTGEKVELIEDEADKEAILKDIDEGLDYLGKAIEIRDDYFDAMMYQNLLWREKAKMELDEEAKNELILQADIAYNRSIQLKLKAEAEAAAEHKTLDLGN